MKLEGGEGGGGGGARGRPGTTEGSPHDKRLLRNPTLLNPVAGKEREQKNKKEEF